MNDDWKGMLDGEGFDGALPDQVQEWLKTPGGSSVEKAERKCLIITPTNNFNYQIPVGVRDVQFTPAGLLLLGAVTLPPVAQVLDGFELTIATSAVITGFTINANGATVVGGPTTLALNGVVELKFYKATNTWYRR